MVVARLAAFLLVAAGILSCVGDVGAQQKGDKGGFAKKGGDATKGGPPSGDATSSDALFDWIDVHVHLRIPPNGTAGAAVFAASQVMAGARIRTMVLEPQPFPDPDSGGRNVYDYDVLVGPVRASSRSWVAIASTR